MANDNLTGRYVILRKNSVFNRPVGSPRAGAAALPSLSTLELDEEDLSPTDLRDIQRDPDVQVAAPVMPMKLIEPVGAPEATPQATGNTWGVEAVGAPDSPFDGDGVVVAVLDTGIRASHEAFQGVDLIRRNFTSEVDEDINGHGTHCAGTIFGRDVNGLRIGVARGVKKALIGKVLGDGGGSSADIAKAINWAFENGANIISMSLGIDFPGFVKRLIRSGVPEEAATSIALEGYRANVNLFSELSEALEANSRMAQACIIIAASGNESERPRYRVAVAPPAAGDGLVSVGALNRTPAGNFTVAGFSNTACNISGPGVSVTSAGHRRDDELVTMSGTSMATPHVVGCAALWAQQQLRTLGRLTSENLAARTLSSAIFVTGANFDDVGNGMVRCPA